MMFAVPAYADYGDDDYYQQQIRAQQDANEQSQMQMEQMQRDNERQNRELEEQRYNDSINQQNQWNSLSPAQQFIRQYGDCQTCVR